MRPPQAHRRAAARRWIVFAVELTQGRENIGKSNAVSDAGYLA
jgi:hypothetical protein